MTVRDTEEHIVVDHAAGVELLLGSLFDWVTWGRP
jgi:hypothetical protein